MNELIYEKTTDVNIRNNYNLGLLCDINVDKYIF